MKDIKVYLTKEFIESVEDSEIDFDLMREFGAEPDGDNYIDIEWMQKGGPKWGVDGFPINIDRMIETLQSLKQKGATHIEMEYHCDHISYPIDAYRITHSTQEDIEAEKAKMTKAQKLEAEKAELRAKLRELEQESRKLT